MTAERLPDNDSPVVVVRSRVSSPTWAADFTAGLLIVIGTVFAIVIVPLGWFSAGALAIEVMVFGAAAVVLLMNLRYTIRSVEVSPAGVTYRYAWKRETVPWPEIRPPMGDVLGGWSYRSPVFFTDLPPGSWTGLATRLVSVEQARAIVDYPSGREWAPSDAWMRAIHSSPEPFRQRIRQYPRLIKVGGVLALSGLTCFVAGAVATALGLVPSCAFSSYSCPTPDWFNDLGYAGIPLLVVGVLSFCVGALGWKSPLSQPVKRP